MPELDLAGCRPMPLGSYLKAIGVLRVIGEQADEGCVGWWSEDRFVLRTHLEAEQIVDFLLDSYRPTPVVSPWNKESGFWEKHRDKLSAIEESSTERLSLFRSTIAAARDAASAAATLPSAKNKAAFIRKLRAALPDDAVEWLDASQLLSDDGAEVSPFLVSGGVDGRLDFARNFAERLALVLPELGAPRDRGGDGRIRSATWLRAALYGEGNPILLRETPGMFEPGSAGGENATTGFAGPPLLNPWNYVLLVEGVLLFAGAAVRRLSRASGTHGQKGGPKASFPFAVRPATQLAGGSARAELWLPLWERPVGILELRHLCTEGRAEWNGRQATDAVEFSSAVAALGAERGITAFARHGIAQRMGNNHLAVPLGSVEVPRCVRSEIDLLRTVDGWVRRFRDLARDKDAPLVLREAAARLDRSIIRVAGGSGPTAVQALLAALAAAEFALAERPGPKSRPGPLELDFEWVGAADDQTAEYRIARAIGGLGQGSGRPLRSDLEDIEPVGSRWRRPSESKLGRPSPDPSSRLRNLFALRMRHALEHGQKVLAAPAPAGVGDVAMLQAGDLDIELIASLSAAFAMVSWWPHRGLCDDEALVPAGYAVLKACCTPGAFADGEASLRIPLEPAIVTAVEAGSILEAVRRAGLRLRGSGVAVQAAVFSAEIAAELDERLLPIALLVPIPDLSVRRLLRAVTLVHDEEME